MSSPGPSEEKKRKPDIFDMMIVLWDAAEEIRGREETRVRLGWVTAPDERAIKRAETFEACWEFLDELANHRDDIRHLILTRRARLKKLEQKNRNG